MKLQAKFYNKSMSPRFRILISSLIALSITMLFFLLVGHSLYNYRKTQQQNIAYSDITYAAGFANDMQKRIEDLLPLVRTECEQGFDRIAGDAAFTPNVRAFSLVRQGIVYCSSAIRSISIPVKQLYPELDLKKPSDIILQQGTRFVPDKPVLVAWLALDKENGAGVIMTLNITPSPYKFFFPRDNSLSGLALIVKDKAISTFDPEVVNVSALPGEASISLSEPIHNRFSLRLYGQPLTNSDISWLILLTILFFILSWVATYYILLLCARTEREILRGIKNHEFFIVYQPVISADTTSISGFEVLIRWEHPRFGLIPPDQFIPYCETQGLIIPLTRYILTQVAQDAHKLMTVLPPDVKISINIAPSHLVASHFRHDVLDFLARMPQGYFQLVFEITERSMLQHGGVKDLFTWLQEQKIAISIDDFGTGHSALLYLERYKPDYLKIDHNFTHSIEKDATTVPVLDAVLSLAKKLHLGVVAEGVENEIQAEYLRKHGVRYFQGFLYSPPLPLAQLQVFIRRWKT